MTKLGNANRGCEAWLAFYAAGRAAQALIVRLARFARLPAENSHFRAAATAYLTAMPGAKRSSSSETYHDRTQAFRPPWRRRPWLAEDPPPFLVCRLPRPQAHGLGRTARVE